LHDALPISAATTKSLTLRPCNSAARLTARSASGAMRASIRAVRDACRGMDETLLDGIVRDSPSQKQPAEAEPAPPRTGAAILGAGRWPTCGHYTANFPEGRFGPPSEMAPFRPLELV